ncbi:MAG: hypothetical protein IPO25_18565 [Saprospiraceae bacterium]|nr:hypothetical protein [Saprospiraceae bacterium]
MMNTFKQASGGALKHTSSFDFILRIERLFLLFLLQLCIVTYGAAQVFPKGMNYQAVARDSKGGLIQSQIVDLKITLFANVSQNRINYYSEEHKVKTNQVGLFDLVIGEGGSIEGNYGLVPWNVENIWLEVAVATTSRSDFSILSQSKLMAVPYTMHALTTNQVEIQNDKGQPYFALHAPGVVSTNWSIFGNANTNNSGNLYHTNALGTTDKVDLIMITDNVERLRILSGGDIVTKLNFEIGKNLNVLGNANIQQKLTIGDSLIVKKNVLLNRLGGTTLVY